jgi:hypothetical protein
MFPLEIEESMYKQGIIYDVNHVCRKCPTKIPVGEMGTVCSTIEEGKKIIKRWQTDRGYGSNYGDYEIRLHVFPWEPFLTKLRKRLFGRVYFESDVDNEVREYNARIAKIQRDGLT